MSTLMTEQVALTDAERESLLGDPIDLIVEAILADRYAKWESEIAARVAEAKAATLETLRREMVQYEANLTNAPKSEAILGAIGAVMAMQGVIQRETYLSVPRGTGGES